MLGRLMDGLGFGFHWATEGLTERDLAHRVSESARSCAETLKHVHDIVEMIECALQARFKIGDTVREFPFWNVINGTMSDGSTMWVKSSAFAEVLEIRPTPVRMCFSGRSSTPGPERHGWQTPRLSERS